MENETEPQQSSLPNIHFAYTSTIKFKKFVKEKSQQDLTPEKETILIPRVSGSAIRKEYDHIVCTASTSSGNAKRCNESRKIIKKKKCKTFEKILTVHALMRAVEMDDVKTVGEYMEHDLNFVINSEDEYGWTAIMCASCAGAEKVVKLFLNHKFDLTVKDKKGNDCLSLAKSRGHKHIVQLLKDHNKSVNKVSNINVNTNSDRNQGRYDLEAFYCEACKESIPANAKSNHLTSTVHNFNAARKSGLKTSYGISESNKGFQMLLKTGWDREKGLGPEGEGHKFPPKIMLKQDRTGLGVKKYVAKVTHNLADVQKTRLERTKTINKRHKEKKLRKDKMKERDLRMILS